MRAVLEALPPRRNRRVHAFCLRAVAESLPGVAALAPVSAGVAAAGRILEDVSFINASGLVRRGAIRRAGQASLAFFERPEWMEAWFPGYTEAIVKRSEEHTSELQSHSDLVCRLLLEKKKDKPCCHPTATCDCSERS